MHDKIVPISINPREFLNNLVKNLSSLYLSYIYICKHPKLPIILIRIQVFDLNGMDITENHILYLTRHIFGIFDNSPHVVHSINNDAMVHEIVMEAFERSLPQSKNNLLKLITPENQFPVKSIQSMHILKGCNRSGNSLGIWTPTLMALWTCYHLEQLRIIKYLKAKQRLTRRLMKQKMSII